MKNEKFTDPEILRLIEGYKKFKTKHFEDTKIFDGLIKHGQRPKILVIACCDSRVDPAIVTGCKAGELFVVRNIANLVPPFEGDSTHHSTSAALEFGVLELGVSNIIVFGHSHCGGISSLMKNTKDENKSDFIDAWMDIAEPAKQRVLTRYPKSSLDEQKHQCEKESLLTSLKNLKTFPWINERVLAKRLFLHAWYFDLRSGTIKTYQSTSGKFIPLESEN